MCDCSLCVRSNSRKLFTNILSILILTVLFVNNGLCKEGKWKRKRETNPFNFVRLVVLRLVYGVASLMGVEDGLSEVANGAFVPPGADDDYGGFDYGRDAEYDYSNNDNDYGEDYY